MIVNTEHEHLASGKLHDFLVILRDANVSISTDEVLSMFQALNHVSIEDKTVFRQALKTTLIKDYTDIPIFETCFREYFSFKTEKKPDKEQLLANILREKNRNDIDLEEPDYLMIKSDRRIYKININDLCFIQSYGDYVKINTKEKVIIAAETLKNMERYLKPHSIRIHKSYLVIKNAINYVEGNLVNVKDQMLPIGQKYREGFFKILREG